MFLNITVIVLYQGYQVYKNIINIDNSDNLAALPNYENIDWVHKHFQELGEQKLSTDIILVGRTLLTKEIQLISTNKV